MHNSLGGLPKRTQTFLFFSIDVNSVEDFLKALSKFKDLITTAKHVKDDRATIDKNKKVASESNTTAPVLPITGVNIAFTKKGLIRVRAFCSIYFQPRTSLTFFFIPAVEGR